MKQTVKRFGILDFLVKKVFLPELAWLERAEEDSEAFPALAAATLKSEKMINSFLEVKWKAARWDHGKCYLSDNKIISENNREPLSSDSVVIWLFQSKIV